jgi:hypothetical protein
MDVVSTLFDVWCNVFQIGGQRVSSEIGLSFGTVAILETMAHCVTVAIVSPLAAQKRVFSFLKKRLKR